MGGKLRSCLHHIWLQRLAIDHAHTDVLLPHGALAGATLCLRARLIVDTELRVSRPRKLPQVEQRNEGCGVRCGGEGCDLTFSFLTGCILMSAESSVVSVSAAAVLSAYNTGTQVIWCVRFGWCGVAGAVCWCTCAASNARAPSSASSFVSSSPSSSPKSSPSSSS